MPSTRLRGDDGDTDAGDEVTGFGDGGQDRVGAGVGEFCAVEVRSIPQAPAASVSTRTGLRNSDFRIRLMDRDNHPFCLSARQKPTYNSRLGRRAHICAEAKVVVWPLNVLGHAAQPTQTGWPNASVSRTASMPGQLLEDVLQRGRIDGPGRDRPTPDEPAFVAVHGL
jgi:hypothetical protein